MRFVKLTLRDSGVEVYVNPDFVQWVSSGKSGGSVLYMHPLDPDFERTITVQESVETIFKSRAMNRDHAR